MSDELYHLLEFIVHNDVPLSCRVPSYALRSLTGETVSAGQDQTSLGAAAPGSWTPLTIALAGSLQLSHIHLHTTVNVIFHTHPSYQPTEPSSRGRSRLLAATAYSVPNTTQGAPSDGPKVIPNDPLVLLFNVGWVPGVVLPGMAGQPSGVTSHGFGLGVFGFFAMAASAGVGAMGMLIYERRRNAGGGMNGLLGGNIGVGGAGMRLVNGYGGYGGYGNYAAGKRD